MEMTRQRIETRAVNYVAVYIHTELDCKVEDGEYSWEIGSIIGSLDKHDFDCIEDCITEYIENWDLPDEGYTQVILKESGEWEDVFWNKYYEVERVVETNKKG